MAAFEYIVLDDSGQERRGVLQADHPRQARQLLRAQGLHALEVSPLSQRGAVIARNRVSTSDLAPLLRQLATLTGAAVPLESALLAASQTGPGTARRALGALRSLVLEGQSLASAMDQQPQSFPAMYSATVAAGEQSGHLSQVLERLADDAERHLKMAQQIRLALLYPALLTITALLISGGLLIYVVPQVVQVFQHLGRPLPGLTRGLIAISEFLQAHGLWLLPLLIGLMGLLRLILRRPAMHHALHRLLLRAPVISRLIRAANSARFARTLSMLTASAVPMLEALRISAHVITSPPLREALEITAARVRDGAALSASLDRTGHFPPITIQMISSGENSGRLEQMLDRAAAHHERELEGMIAIFLGLFEPALILFMGGFVLLIVLAILLPIFDLNQIVK